MAAAAAVAAVMVVVVVAAEQTGFSSGAPKRRRRMLCCAGCNKNFLIKSLTCTAADLLASLWGPGESEKETISPTSKRRRRRNGEMERTEGERRTERETAKKRR